MALCGPNRWSGGKVLCSPGSRAGNWLGGGRIQVEKQWGEGGKKKRGRPLPLLSSFRLFLSLCLTALWPPSWFPAGPGVTWSLWAPGQEPLRGVAGSARPLWREKRLLMPGCRVWPEQLHLRGKSQRTISRIFYFSNKVVTDCLLWYIDTVTRHFKISLLIGSQAMHLMAMYRISC